MWRKSDSTGSYPTNYLFLNPIIGVNTALSTKDDAHFNSIFGINMSYKIHTNRIYSQLIIDNSKISAFQLGFIGYDFIFSKLDLLLEYNQAQQNTYLNLNKRLNYSQTNLPLAHPLTSGFKELILKLDYQFKSFFVQNKIIFSESPVKDSVNIGVSILQELSDNTNNDYIRVNILSNQLELGYRMNKKYNLQLFIGNVSRYHFTQEVSMTNYVYIGIRTRIKNKTLDW